MNRTTLIVWLDTALLMLGGFVLMAMIMIKYVTEATSAVDMMPVGNVAVNIEWPADIDADVDLWALSPGDVRAVGYSNKGGRVFNLLRDDLGKGSNDMTPYNMEFAVTRGIPAGEYVVNVHLYRGTPPISVRVIVTALRASGTSSELATTTVQLTHENQELTAVRFKLDDKGYLVGGSVHDLYRPLRAAGSP